MYDKEKGKGKVQNKNKNAVMSTKYNKSTQRKNHKE